MNLIRYVVNLECSSPLGMASGNITKAQINASSSLDILHTPTMGRLNGTSGWCASDKDKSPYFQVNLIIIVWCIQFCLALIGRSFINGQVEFVDEMEIAKIGIQGLMLYSTQAFVKSFTVSYAVYKDQWMTYQVNGATRVRMIYLF